MTACGRIRYVIRVAAWGSIRYMVGEAPIRIGGSVRVMVVVVLMSFYLQELSGIGLVGPLCRVCVADCRTAAILVIAVVGPIDWTSVVMLVMRGAVTEAFDPSLQLFGMAESMSMFGVMMLTRVLARENAV